MKRKKKAKKKSGALAGAQQRQDYRTPEAMRMRIVKFARSQEMSVLDPCAGVHRSDHWADHNYTKAGDGMNADWTVCPFVFANLEYRQAMEWADRLHEVRNTVRLGVYLVPNYSDTAWFTRMVDGARSVVTLKGRLSFELPFKVRRALAAKGKRIRPAPARFPSVLIAFGCDAELHAAWVKRWQHDDRARVWTLAPELVDAHHGTGAFLDASPLH